ncbi:uncharacterized protein PV06_03465 [Exophiala oligosperma]|uniref:Uncharacterized protein n=2 Tax=Chaetothyriales TaxID=34395 RepID=A0A0D2EAS3_9EURO|nr:uncharacterized protein PV06_03465 [Exophiala oligosperma]KAJ9608587.1 hypothetical protein H2204_015665 [Knufia peltigerae]KIW45044.1 hypothetical protein PV06_03465 [Exophiala oligosperma]
MAKGATAQRVVGFATEVNSSRPPRDDEYFVMYRFTKHASKCNLCADPYASYQRDLDLCDRGRSYARDVASYLYSKGGKPFSKIDRSNGDTVEVEVPAECAVIKELVKAWGRGMTLTKAKKPVIVNSSKTTEKHERVEIPKAAPKAKEHFYEEPVRDRRTRDYDVVEVIPNSSRRDRRERVYRDDRGEERYHYVRRERPVSYHGSKGSLYERDEEEKRRRRGYDEQPIVIIAEPSRRYKR